MGSVLALDLGTKTGFAIMNGGVVTSGTHRLRRDVKASGVRFLEFRNWLIATIDTCGIDTVYFERVYAHKGTDAAHVYGGFMYTLAAVCVEKKIVCVGVPVSTIKKFATGNGNATKEEMIAAARSRGLNPVDDNEADALAILFLALKTMKRDGNRYFPYLSNCGSQPPASSLASENF
jgi:Holliday junction resolvasome RuvABC endonuclease subunit